MAVLHLERRGAVALLTLDRPGRLNAIGSDTIAELHAHLDALEAAGGTRAIVVTGAGGTFCAGADISELRTIDDGTGFATFVRGLTDAFGRLAGLPIPSIAAIERLALGGGCELALACDLRLAAPGARIGVPEIKLGLLPAASGTQRLTRLLPDAVVKHMLITGEPLPADDALRFGLCNAIADDVLARAIELATSIADGPPLAIAAAKELVEVAHVSELDEGIARERSTVAELFDTADRIEGLAAFTEKRPPRFTGS
jgi:enoyl-CoA hydratase